MEIRTPQQLKVVAFYKEVIGGPGITVSASIAKNACLPFLFPPVYRHAAAFLVGDEATAAKDTIRHETTVAITNMSNATVNATVSIHSTTGMLASFLKILQPNGFAKVTGADIPPFVPLPFIGSVRVEYNDTGLGALLACEEIVQKHVIGGPRHLSMAMSVVEVQPIPLR